MKYVVRLFVMLGLLATTSSAQAEDLAEAGQVEIPRSVYDHLVEQGRTTAVSRPASASHALGSARVAMTLGSDLQAGGKVTVELAVDVLEDQWTLVPVLPAGTAVESVEVGGSSVQLLATPEGLAWGTRRAGSFVMNLVYRVDVRVSEGGWSIGLPVPPAAATTLDVRLPGTGLDVAVIPAAGLRTTTAGQSTRVEAAIPTTRGVQLSWRPPASTGHALSRAAYTGELVGEAVRWTGELDVELWQDETVTLPLLPRTITLNEVVVDDATAPILVSGNQFSTLVKGRGRHTVRIGFEVPVQRTDGPPRVALEVPEVPISQFELTLPGKKEISVTPAANVVASQRGTSTVARVHIPLSRQVTLAWAEAVPEDVRAEVRANAGLYHAAHAEEGVLYVRALVNFEVTRGETHVLRLRVPPGVQVHRVASPSGAVADWRMAEEDESSGRGRELTVFLDRQLTEGLVVEVAYDRSLPTDGSAEDASSVEIPLLRAEGVHRQRGMVVLLQSQDLALEPLGEDLETVTRVGENQLPPFVRDALEMSVAHTFKYVEDPPRLAVRPTVPERQRGRFDARVDSLVSLGEVSLKGATTVEVDVKSGRIMELELSLPERVSLLGLTGPSVRQHTVESTSDAQRVHVEFTQEMEGQFRLELNYEFLLASGDGEGDPGSSPPQEATGASSRRVAVPSISVLDAEVEQGRLAVEALSAVEVQPAQVERLTPLDLGELPRQLVLRTTNPILLAYKYVRPPYRLDLEITPHELVELQPAAIDQAHYRTLFTRDGLAVTTARFTVRNSGEQFLRLRLPTGSKVWSTFVDGRAVKPARSVDEEGVAWHLVKIIHSTRDFPVEMIFETPAPPISGLGTVTGDLPLPEILVTHSRWDIFVPEGVQYGQPRGNLDLLVAGRSVAGEEMAQVAGMEAGERTQDMGPLRIQVPTAGIHFAFEKLYANRSKDLAGFRLPYASGLGHTLGQFLTLAGTAFVWLGLWWGRRRPRLAGASILTGLLMLALLVGRYQQSTGLAMNLSIVLLIATALAWAWRRRMEGLEEMP